MYNAQTGPCPAHGSGHRYGECTLVSTSGTFKNPSSATATKAKEQVMPFEEALRLCRALSNAKFDETIEVCVCPPSFT